jgi:hypothetical protein
MHAYAGDVVEFERGQKEILVVGRVARLRSIGRADPELRFQQIRNRFATPEKINDSPETAPSKRIGAQFPGYEEPLLGVQAVLEITLAQIPSECPHFDCWLQRLEALIQAVD